MKRKKWLTWVLVLAAVLGLTGCRDDTSSAAAIDLAIISGYHSNAPAPALQSDTVTGAIVNSTTSYGSACVIVNDGAPYVAADFTIKAPAEALSATKRQEIARVLKRMSDVRSSEVVINGGGTGYRFNQEGNQVTYRCDVRRVTTINFDRKVVRNFAAEMNRKADAVSSELDRCLVNSEVAYEAPFDVNDSFAEIFGAYAEAQSKE